MKEPMPSLATSLGPSTSQLILACWASACAASPKCWGVAWLAGRLAHSLANSTPATMATARSKVEASSGALRAPMVAFCKVRACGLDLVAV